MSETEIETTETPDTEGEDAETGAPVETDTDEPDLDGAETTEDGGQDETPSEPQPEPVDEKEIERVGKALDKLRSSNAGRVSSIMGDSAVDVVPCPLCADVAPGFIWHPNIAKLDESVENDLRALLGMSMRGQLRPHPDAEICETCDGMGQVETPSKVPGFDVVDCPSCARTGRILKPSVLSVQLGPQDNGTHPLVTGPTVVSGDEPPEVAKLRSEGYMVFKQPDLSPTPAVYPTP